jgi:HPt (histidine-containing phosphotransfer) domain-containing protein
VVRVNVSPPASGLPVLDPQCIQQLGEELESLPAALSFLASYLNLLSDRLATICAAVGSADSDAAVDRTLSLKVTSDMVGARQLAALAEALEGLVCSEDWGSAEPLLEVLATAVAAVVAAGRTVIEGRVQA